MTAKRKRLLTHIRMGDVEVSIWKDQTTTIRRVYTDTNGEWRYFRDLRTTDLPYAISLLNCAYELITADFLKRLKRLTKIEEK